VLRQTCQDFELIIIDDASTDGSLAEVQKFNDPRIRLLYRNAPGPGGYAARNLGIKESRGEWIAFLDADDEWYPEHLNKMFKLSSLFPEVYFMSCGWDVYENERKESNAYFNCYKLKGAHLLSLECYLNNFINKKGSVWSSVACIKKISPVSSNLFPSEKQAKRGGDLYAWLKMICHHRKMAWSDHVGAIYFRDSVNMVSKEAAFSSSLMSKESFNSISLNLSNSEKILLKKYFNLQIKHAWMCNLLTNNKNFNLRNKLYWKDDMSSSLALVLLSVTPSFFVKFLIRYRLKSFLRLFLKKIRSIWS
jgi:glycosyltransferase involved in cell wall biosynthesis